MLRLMIVVVCVFALSLDGNAQNSAPVIEEILVTAQKTTENSQDVPIALNAFSEDLLDEAQITSATDLQFFVPSLTYSDTGTGTPNFSIRGVGANSTVAGADAGVGVHINDVYVNSGYAGGALFDVEQAMVLRGPQGTLYGRNSTGGAINIRTRRPDEEFGGYLEAGVGTFDARTVEGAINLPVSDAVGFRLAGFYVKSDGYTENQFTGNDINGDDAYILRPTLSLRLSDRTSLDIIGSYLKSQDDSLGFDDLTCRRDTTSALGCVANQRGNDTPAPLATIGGVGLLFAGATAGDPFAGSPNPRDPYDTFIDLEPNSNATIKDVTLDFEHNFDRHRLNILLGALQTDSDTLRDNDNLVGLVPFAFPVALSDLTPDLTGALGGNSLGAFTAAFGYNYFETEDRQYVQEIRLRSEYHGNTNFLIGAFHLTTDFSSEFIRATTGLDAYALVLDSSAAPTLPPFIYDKNSMSDVESTAIFGELYQDLSDTLVLTLGLRFTRDEKDVDKTTLALSGIFDPTTGEIVFDPSDRVVADRTFNEPTGRVTLTWEPDLEGTDSSLFYATLSRGYRSGGINNATSRRQLFYDSEKLNALELGTKNIFLNERARLNATVFYYDYNDYQIDEVGLFNVDAKAWGAELEYDQYLSANWRVSLAASYLNTEVDSGSSINRRNPTGSEPDLVALGDIAGANCIIDRATFETPLFLGGLGSNPFLLAQLGQTCESNSFSNGLPDGVPISLSGNELPNSPEWTARVGIEYFGTWSESLDVFARLDYYWQSDFSGRVFNDRVDDVDSWQVLNFFTEFRFHDAYYAHLGLTNLLDDDHITGTGLRGVEDGLATELFLLPPRTATLTLGVSF